MFKKILVLSLIISVSSSCVSSKIYKELDGKYTSLKNDYDSLSTQNEAVINERNSLQNQLDQLQKKYDSLITDRNALQQELTALHKKYEALNESYSALEQNSSKEIADNIQKNRELLAQLEAKELALAAENDRLLKLEADMQERSQRIAELELLITSKDQAMRDLKNAISSALTAFEGKGLTVEQRNGKVYVSMENKLLFKSGSWAIGSKGRIAIEQLGSVLADNPEIAVLIEGHTDNVGSEQYNMALSQRRATSVLNYLTEQGIDKKILTAKGLGEVKPIASNANPAGRALNRRTEIYIIYLNKKE